MLFTRLLEIAVAAVLCCTVNAQDDNFRFQRQAGTCQTARGESGTCLNIKQCPPLVDLLTTQRGNRSVVEYLRQSVCGYEGNEPKVCCAGDGRRTASLNSVLPSPPDCGRAASVDHPRIVGGRPAELGAWPWIVALGFRSRSVPRPEWLCGGSLITKRHVITAAHCNRHPRLTLYIARMGDLNLDPNVADGASPQDILIDKVIAHPEYSPTKFFNDIALVKLREDVRLSPLVQPVCLPTPELKAKNIVGYQPFIAGWGGTSFKGPSSSRLLEIQIPIINNKDCNEKFKTKGASIISQQLCAGTPAGGKDACQGDSGGPMMLPVGEDFFLIGVVSYGYKCAEPGFPGVYTRVADYVDWIKESVSK